MPQIDAVTVASSALRRFKAIGPVLAETPSPERLLRDAGHARVERGITFVDVVDAAGEITSAAVIAHRIRVTTGPLERMGGKGHLDPDPFRNGALLSAGRRYLSLWSQAGLSPIQGQDPGKIRSTAVGAGMLGTERKCEAFSAYCAASDAMDFRERLAVDAIVLHDTPIQDVGQKLGRKTDRSSAITIGTYAMRCGLEKLAIHFGMLDEAVDRPAPADARALPPEMVALLGAIDAREGASA